MKRRTRRTRRTRPLRLRGVRGGRGGDTPAWRGVGHTQLQGGTRELDFAVHNWINKGMLDVAMGGIHCKPHFSPERVRQIALHILEELNEAAGPHIKGVTFHEAHRRHRRGS